MAPSDLRLESVSGKAGLTSFIGLTRRIYAGDPSWVQPLTLERLDHLNQKKNPFLRAIDVRYWIAWRGSEPVGRISAQINRRHLERYRDATGHFGFLDAIDDPAVFAALLGAAEDWLRRQGMRRLAGPFNLSINDECGLLVEGFDTPPNLMMGHARPYYRERVEALGYTKLKDLLAYDFDVAAPWPPAARRLLDRLRRMPGVRIRPLDMRRYEEEIATVCRIFNDAWADNWWFIPFGEDEALYLAKSLKPLVNPGSFAIGELDGEPVAMTAALPNLNEAIRDLDGRLLPFGWARLLWRLKVKGLKTGRMPLMGVVRRLQGTPKGAALALGIIDAVKSHHAARGYERAELSWILEDNEAVKAVIHAVGAVPYKRYRIYGKALA
ncbi:hypothetical protein [Benzoatithermus flavus]|uniref:N-acetyltransferase domain-containing protein n=1 Tax=Benzoatithermus flavus TaxID=3108223 RepID=A0ABU8XME3_9PROT